MVLFYKKEDNYMKKFLSFFITLAMILSLFAVPVNVAAEEAEAKVVSVDSMDFDLWSGNAQKKVNTTDKMEGSGCLEIYGADINLLSPDIGIIVDGGVKTQKNLEMWFYCEDASALTTDSNIIIHRNDFESKLKIPVAKIQNGWNKLDLSLSLVVTKIDGIDSLEINLATGGKAQKFMIDDIAFAPVTKVEDTAALSEIVETAKTFNTKYLSDAQKARLEALLIRAEAPLTQHDADALAADISDLIMEGDLERGITTHGRAYFIDDELYMSYSSTGFSVRFYGTELKAQMRTAGGNSAILNIYVDRDDTTYELNRNVSNASEAQTALNEYNGICPHIQPGAAAAEYTLVSGLEEGIHTVTVLKRGEVSYTSRAILMGLSTDGRLLDPPAKSSRRIEIIGDSNITAFGNMALGGGGYSVPTQDSTVSFSGYIANALGAEYSVVARSGCTVTPGLSGLCTEGFMYNTYLYTDYWNYGDAATSGAWNGPGSNINQDDPSRFNYVSQEKLYDFEKADNDVVVVHIGDNDHDGRAGSEGTNTSKFVKKMEDFIGQIRSANPSAYIIVTFSMCGYLDWRNVMDTAVENAKANGEDRICFVSLNSYDNKAPAGHPSNKTHYNAAQEIVEKIREVTGWQGAAREVYSDPTMENINIVPSASYASQGETVSFTLPKNADPETVSVTSHGTDISFSVSEDNVFSFTMPEGSVMIHADEKTVVYGDLDNNGSVTVDDALTALQISVGKIQPIDGQLDAGDVDASGDVTVNDALLILQKAVGKIESFLVENR